MKIKTSELRGAALDWVVAKCEGTLGYYVQPNIKRGTTKWEIIPQTRRYSTNWTHTGTIIDREMRKFGFDLWSGAHVPPGQFAATYCRGVPDSYVYGPTPLIAAMRCYVASKLGDVVEIPDELVEKS